MHLVVPGLKPLSPDRVPAGWSPPSPDGAWWFDGSVWVLARWVPKLSGTILSRRRSSRAFDRLEAIHGQ